MASLTPLDTALATIAKVITIKEDHEDGITTYREFLNQLDNLLD